MIRERALGHQQIYQYKVHLAKLALTVNAVPSRFAPKVKSYLLSIFEDFPDYLFHDDTTAGLEVRARRDDLFSEPAGSLRSSESGFEMLPLD